MDVQSRFLALALVLFGALSAGSSPAAYAADDEYNFNWLDPDKKIYVLQNRKYLKSKKVLLSALGGFGMSNPYRDVKNADVRLGYYFHEDWGIEAFGQFYSNSSNATMDALKIISSTSLPIVREIQSNVGLLFQWSPWYSKINVFNSILYFDWYFSAGIGSMRTQLDINRNVNNAPDLVTENLTPILVGTGHQFHVSQNFVVRLDFMGAFYSAKLLGTSGDSRWYSNYTFNIGAGFRL